MSADPAGGQDAADALAHRAADALAALGFPRAPAAVLMALSLDEDGRMTAAELAERLGLSAGAISGATRYLALLGMVQVARVPGSRKQVFALPPVPWYAATLTGDRNAPFREVLAAGVRDLPSGAARDRTEETVAFFDFLRGELPALWQRWQAR